MASVLMCTYGGLIVYIQASSHAQNLKLCWITNCQLHGKCQHYSLFLPNSPLHLGSCGLSELARLCRCLRPAPVGPVFLSWTSFISVAEPFLSSIGPPGPLNCWHRPPNSSSSVLWAPACGKNCEMCFICILIRLAKRSRTSALHWIHNVNKCQLFCLNSPAILWGKCFTLSRYFSR